MSDSTTDNRSISEFPDRNFLLEMQRGLAQEVAGLKEQLQGKRQLLNAVERRLHGVDRQASRT